MELIGRTNELQALAEVHKRVAADGGREVVLVVGEAGLGKTTLTAAAARAAFDEGSLRDLRPLRGRSGQPVPVLRRGVGTLRGARHRRAAGAARPARSRRTSPGSCHRSRRRLPGLPATKGTDMDTERYLLFAAVAGSSPTMSQGTPVVLVLDDLQWADKGSLLLLRHLAGAEQISAAVDPRHVP